MKWCADCAVQVALMKVEKQKAKAARLQAKQDRLAVKLRKELIKTIPKLKAEAEKACHAWIRYRDRHLPCICCGGWPKSESLTGGDWDACHFRGRGAADHLRYHEDNIHRGLKSCNTYGHKDYRGGLIARIGIERVEALERDQTIVKWTPTMLREIRDGFKARLKAAMAEEKKLPADREARSPPA